MTHYLALILPCFNPPEGWEQVVVKSYQEILQKVDRPVQLCIVNDGSQYDISLAVEILRTKIRLLHYIDNRENRGKGAALRSGIREANAAYYIYTDIDLPYTTDSILEVYQQLLTGHDVVAGIKDKTYYEQTPPVRKFISRVLRWCIRNLLNMSIADTQCGLKGFNEKGKHIFLSTTIDRYLFDLEFIYLSSKKKEDIAMKAVEVHLRPGIIFRKMNPKILLQEGRNFLKILMK